MDEFERALDEIDAALESDDIDAALRLARAARRQFPAEPDVHLVLGDVLFEADELEAAQDAYVNATRLAPDSEAAAAALGWVQFARCDFAAARKSATRSNNLEANASAWALLARLEERDGQLDEAERAARRAHAMDADAYPMPYRISEADFRVAVGEALDRLPDEFRAAVDGEVAVLVHSVPAVELLQSESPPLDPELLGLYAGTPLPERDAAATSRLPDIVYLFQRNLENVAIDRDELLEQIAITVYHEIGHYLGYDDDELDERGFG